MIKDLTRRAANDKLTNKQIDKLLQSNNNIISTSESLKNKNSLKSTYTSEPIKRIASAKLFGRTTRPQDNNSNLYITNNKVKTPSIKSKPNISQNESLHSNNLENCNYIMINISVSNLEDMIAEIKQKGFEKFRFEIEDRLKEKKRAEIIVDSLQKQYNAQNKHLCLHGVKHIQEMLLMKGCGEVI
jgi:hypothetical protein